MESTRGRPENGQFLIGGASVAVIVALLMVIYVLNSSDTGQQSVATKPGVTTTLGEVRNPGTNGSHGDSSTGKGGRVTTTTDPGQPGKVLFTMAFAGDLLPHQPLNNQAAAYGNSSGQDYDYAPMFEPIKGVIGGADLAICHMEVPTVPEGEKVTSYPSFGAPPELVVGAKSAGYDGCSTASNHSLDRGRAGLDRLLDTFDANKMLHNGTARTEAEGDGRATVYTVKGFKVAHLSYAYDFNGYKIPSDAPWSVNQIDPDKIKKRAQEAKEAGADLVVVSLHWGTEYVHDPTDQQKQWADQIMASPDVDLIIGHHAHVVQPIGKVNGKFVVWGLGNQVSNQTQLPRRDGLTVRVDVEKANGKLRVAEIEAIPTFVDLPSFRILPVVQTLEAGTASGALQDQLRASYDRTAEVIEGAPTEGVELAAKP